jgi:hypothetical protein
MLFNNGENVVGVRVIDATSYVIELIDAYVIFSFDKESGDLISIELFPVFFQNFFTQFTREEIGGAASIQSFEE